VQTFKWDDRRLELVGAQDMPMGELRWMEKQIGGDANSAGIADTLVGRILVSLKRANIHVRPQDLDSYTLRDFDVQGDDEDDVPAGEDPTTAGVPVDR
jgi:hypothetical protein